MNQILQVCKKSLLYFTSKNTHESLNFPPAGNYMFKVNNRNTRTPFSSGSIANFEQVHAGWD